MSFILSILLIVGIIAGTNHAFAGIGVGCGFVTATFQYIEAFSDNTTSEQRYYFVKRSLEESLRCLQAAEPQTQNEQVFVQAKIESIKTSISALKALRDYRADEAVTKRAIF